MLELLILPNRKMPANWQQLATAAEHATRRLGPALQQAKADVDALLDRPVTLPPLPPPFADHLVSQQFAYEQHYKFMQHTHLGARAAKLQNRPGAFAGEALLDRVAEAATAGVIVGRFVSAAHMMTSAPQLAKVSPLLAQQGMRRADAVLADAMRDYTSQAAQGRAAMYPSGRSVMIVMSQLVPHLPAAKKHAIKDRLFLATRPG